MKHRVGCQLPLLLLLQLLLGARPCQAFPKRHENPFEGRKRVILHQSKNLEVVMNVVPAKERNETVIEIYNNNYCYDFIKRLLHCGEWLLLKLTLLIGLSTSVALLLHPASVVQYVLRRISLPQDDTIFPWEKWMLRILASHHLLYVAGLQYKIPQAKALASVPLFWSTMMVTLLGTFFVSLGIGSIWVLGVVSFLLSLSMWALLLNENGPVEKHER
jgi:hypothetical protein